MYSLKKKMKIFIKVFPIIFQTSMGAGKSRCDVINGTTYPQMFDGFHLFDQQTSIVLHRIKLTQKPCSLFLGDK